MCMCVCVCVRARACVRACVRACCEIQTCGARTTEARAELVAAMVALCTSDGSNCDMGVYIQYDIHTYMNTYTHTFIIPYEFIPRIYIIVCVCVCVHDEIIDAYIVYITGTRSLAYMYIYIIIVTWASIYNTTYIHTYIHTCMHAYIHTFIIPYKFLTRTYIMCVCVCVHYELIDTYIVYIMN
jgi:hypothetical protein